MRRIAGTLHLVALTVAARRDTAGVLDDLYELDREALPALPDGDVVELGDFGEQGRWPRRGGGTGRAFPVRVAVATDRPGGHGCAPGQSADPGHMRRGKALPLITVPG